MRALHVPSPGADAVLGEVAAPDVSDGQVLIEVRAAPAVPAEAARGGQPTPVSIPVLTPLPGADLDGVCDLNGACT